ncbi:polyprenyl synthetase family protein [Alicyclobacillus cycloheptanicus]|uniref:Heptaprenyl diphosphate synthase n=1 Tax=Alicyclobacillus cycloheptanicus TaxID=1457 RepID=A0ABT9XDX5_9BACL|nr:polyprenyl synthetase family protein [Alicyclobacillus cycloheptanicus]MDQ0188497.1 heptaprenyl diphosphate synthase [Alicyclobacillus cycloheptanicus]WDM01186.1 polyprenyl synthetase family protein [Alicyclobacillus cycloheptanicus]
MEMQEVIERYQPDLEAVEALLEQQVRSENPQLTEVNESLLRAGGKRIRPLFALMCSRVGSGRPDWLHVLAGAVELIHMATLVHDDVVDDAATRRGKPTVRAQYGNRAAMYAGDFLFGRAIRMLSDIPNRDIHLELSGAIVRMCEGEIEQIQDLFNWRQSLRRYLRRVERKTALLFSVSCSLGAAASRADPQLVRVLRRFGYFTGMAFQITDDVLDFVADEQTVGKPVGGDLRQGNLTLPALHASTEPAVGDELRQRIHPNMSRNDVETSIELVRASSGLPFAKQLARQYMDKAMVQLHRLPAGPLQEDLATVARFVNQRMY